MYYNMCYNLDIPFSTMWTRAAVRAAFLACGQFGLVGLLYKNDKSNWMNYVIKTRGKEFKKCRDWVIDNMTSHVQETAVGSALSLHLMLGIMDTRRNVYLRAQFLRVRTRFCLSCIACNIAHSNFQGWTYSIQLATARKVTNSKSQTASNKEQYSSSYFSVREEHFTEKHLFFYKCLLPMLISLRILDDTAKLQSSSVKKYSRSLRSLVK